MAQEQIDTRKILEELNSLRRKINEIEVAVAKSNKDNVLREMFGTFKFNEPIDELMKKVDKELYDE